METDEWMFFSEFEGHVSSPVFYALNRQETNDLFCINLSGGTIGLMRVEVGEETTFWQEGLSNASPFKGNTPTLWPAEIRLIPDLHGQQGTTDNFSQPLD